MRASKILSIFAILGVAGIVAAQNEPPGARREMDNFYARGDAMVNSGHMDQYLSLFAPGFYFVDAEGQRQEAPVFRANLLRAARVWRDLKLHTMVKNIQLQEGELTVWVEQVLSHREMHNGKWVWMTRTTRYADGLARSGGDWRYVSSLQLFTNEPWSFKTNG